LERLRMTYSGKSDADKIIARANAIGDTENGLLNNIMSMVGD
jgi:hypothetical protein